MDPTQDLMKEVFCLHEKMDEFFVKIRKARMAFENNLHLDAYTLANKLSTIVSNLTKDLQELCERDKRFKELLASAEAMHFEEIHREVLENLENFQKRTDKFLQEIGTLVNGLREIAHLPKQEFSVG